MSKINSNIENRAASLVGMIFVESALDLAAK